MLGMVFTEFLEMTDDRFGPATTERVIDKARPGSGAAYTAYGAYDHAEMAAMVGALGQETGLAPEALQIVFGRHLFDRLMHHHGDLAAAFHDPFDMLAGIEEVIHVAVRRIYPHSELPRFEARRDGPDRLVLTYRSARPFGPLCHGLIEGCCAHYGVPVDIAAEDRSTPGASHVVFTVTRGRPAP